MTYPGTSDLAELLPDALVVIDQAGRLKWANASAERLLGTSAGEVVGGSTLEFVHPQDTEVVASALTSIQAKDVGTPIEIRVRTAAGWKLVELVGTNLLDHPTVQGLVLCLRDLTERRRWEVATDEVSRFRGLVHNAATIIMLLDANGRVDSVSAAITRLLGHDQELVEGRLLVDFVAKDDRERLAEVLSQAGQANEGEPRRLKLEVHMLDRSGAKGVPFELHIVNLLDDPTIRGLVVSGHDVTELRRSLEQLDEAQAELVRQERLAAVGELASVIGHELRNPLGAAINYLFLTRQRMADLLDPEIDDHLSMVERQIRRAAKLSEDLTTYVREHRPDCERIDLRFVIDEVLDATPRPDNVEVEVNDPALNLEADAAQLTQMLTNLVTNAYQAMPDGGALRISMTECKNWVDIEVHDTGVGIDPEVVHRVFDPFFTTKAEGTGLGLSIVQRLAEAHGGGVRIESGHGTGTVVTLSLPRTVNTKSAAKV